MNFLKRFVFVFICSTFALIPAASDSLSADLGLSTLDAFSPDGDGVNDELTVTIFYEGGSPKVSFWQLSVIDQRGFTIKTFSGKNQKIPRYIVWDGSTDTGEGIYSLNDYALILRVTPSLKDQKKISQKQIFISKNFTSGILLETVEKDKRWRFSVNSLQFASGRAELKTGTEEQLMFNNYILDVIAAKLSEIPDVAVTISAFENNFENTARSNIDKTLPLTQARAEEILELLVRKGVSRSRLSAIGRGGADELSSPTDEVNSWKNCRLEFNLEKVKVD